MMLGDSDAPAVDMVGVTRRFEGGAAVDNINLTIPRGTTLGLIGPNGAGKTTAIRMLMGTLAPTSGEVRLFGMNVARHAATIRHHVGYVPERHDVYPWMTVGEAVRFTASFYPMWDAGYCDEMLDMFTLDVCKKVGRLSRWIPDGTVYQTINRREWMLTVTSFSAAVEERLKAENSGESVDVFDVNLGELFKDYILEGDAR